jgi:alpha-N-arabinofuranosidase
MNSIKVKTAKKRYKTSPDLYGIFFEDINRVGDGGIYPEMLRNRSFEDSILPIGCKPVENGRFLITPTGYKCPFNNGEGLDEWKDKVPPTKIPAWYVRGENSDIEINLDYNDTLNKNRLASMSIEFKKDYSDNSVFNIGYAGMYVKEGEQYNFFMFAKSDKKQTVEISLRDKSGIRIYASQTIDISPGEFKKYDCVLTSNATETDSTFHISSTYRGTIKLGFISLMPVETYKRRVNGLRKDIVKLLKNMNSNFLRFPGGCIVEGLTKETAMRFENTIGPVWERPSHWLLWFYRTTNGLGFHEYLQLCEDINLEPMYVINCGMTCQHKNPDFFDDELTNVFLQDAINAIE